MTKNCTSTQKHMFYSFLRPVSSYQSCFGNLCRSKCYILQFIEYGEVLSLKLGCCLGCNKSEICVPNTKKLTYLCQFMHKSSIAR